MSASKIYLEIPQAWVEDADAMGISKVEWARRMVRCGRRQWGFDHVEEPDYPHLKLEQSAKDPTEDVEDVIDDAIVRNLSTTKGISEDELLEFVVGDLEDQFSNRLEALLDAGQIDYSPSKGGLIKR